MSLRVHRCFLLENRKHLLQMHHAGVCGVNKLPLIVLKPLSGISLVYSSSPVVFAHWDLGMLLAHCGWPAMMANTIYAPDIIILRPELREINVKVERICILLIPSDRPATPEFGVPLWHSWDQRDRRPRPVPFCPDVLQRCVAREQALDQRVGNSLGWDCHWATKCEYGQQQTSSRIPTL